MAEIVAALELASTILSLLKALMAIYEYTV
jgi:hypothetical protein